MSRLWPCWSTARKAAATRSVASGTRSSRSSSGPSSFPTRRRRRCDDAMKIVIPGGTGQVGMVLARALGAAGHEVVLLSRAAGEGTPRRVLWDGRTLGPWTAEMEGADAVINLAGRSVNCRYTPENRREIID